MAAPLTSLRHSPRTEPRPVRRPDGTSRSKPHRC